MKALGRLNITYFLVGFLGFLTTWILDMIYMFLHKEGVLRPNQIIKGVFSTFGPHYLLSRCLYDISQTYKEESGLPNTSPFTYAVSGRVFILLCLQAAGDCLLLALHEFRKEKTTHFGVNSMRSQVLHWAFRHQFHEKPSVTPGCPGLLDFTNAEAACVTTAGDVSAADTAEFRKCRGTMCYCWM